MKNRNRVPIALGYGLVAIAVIFFAATYWAGLEAQKNYRRLLDQQAGSSSINWEETTYDRGWFFSEAVTRVSLVHPALPDGGLAWSFEHLIYHGLLPSAWWPQLRSSKQSGPVAVSTLLADFDDNTATWRELVHNGEPLEAFFSLAYNGSSEFDFTLLPVTITSPGSIDRLVFSGLQGRVSLSAGGLCQGGDVTFSGLQLTTRLGRLEASGAMVLGGSGCFVDRASGEMIVAKNLLQTELQQRFQQQMRSAAIAEGRETDEQQLIRLASGKTEQLLSLLTASGYLVFDNNNDDYRLTVGFAEGKFVINGKEREPVSFFSSLALFGQMMQL